MSEVLPLAGSVIMLAGMCIAFIAATAHEKSAWKLAFGMLLLGAALIAVGVAL